MKKSELLRRASPLIWNGRKEIDRSGRGPTVSQFICHAIRVACYNTADYDQATELRQWILRDLLGCFTLETWLEQHHGISGIDNSRSKTIKCQETRKAWVKWMIQYWEERGE